MTPIEMAEAMEGRARVRRKITNRENTGDRLSDQLEQAATMLRQQQAEIADKKLVNDTFADLIKKQCKKIEEKQAEIEALNELNTMLKDAIEKRIEMDAERYKWLRAEFAAGRETYLAEGIPSGESLDKYIDGKLK